MEKKFKIRAYGRSELAIEYFPYLCQKSAYEKFKGWLEVNPVLRPLLTLNQRTYTPAQVALIIDQLGEPEEWV